MRCFGLHTCVAESAFAKNCNVSLLFCNKLKQTGAFSTTPSGSLFRWRLGLLIYFLTVFLCRYSNRWRNRIVFRARECCHRFSLSVILFTVLPQSLLIKHYIMKSMVLTMNIPLVQDLHTHTVSSELWLRDLHTANNTCKVIIYLLSLDFNVAFVVIR